MPQLGLAIFSRWILPAALVLGHGSGMALAEPRPQRVVSLNLCTDQLLLALADREQIASLSHLAGDPEISFMADRASGLPLNKGRAEAILFEGADLVLAGTYGQHHQAALLDSQGIEVLALGHWSSLREGRDQVRTLARRLGHPERGEALVAQIDAALERTRNVTPSGPSLLVYDRGGWVTAANSLLGEILTHMGFKPHQNALGFPAGGRARLEAIVAAPPDYMLVDEDASRSMDMGTALFVHPALIAAVPLERRLVVPGRLTICGGPSTPAAIDALVRYVWSKVR